MEETIKQIIDEARKSIQKLNTEKIMCFVTDHSDKIISGRIVSKNSHKGFSHLNLRLFLSMLDVDGARSIVMLHNHPGNTMFTSKDDDVITEYVKRFCELAEIRMYDHIILMKDSNNFYSYRENKRFDLLSQ